MLRFDAKLSTWARALKGKKKLELYSDSDSLIGLNQSPRSNPSA